MLLSGLARNIVAPRFQAPAVGEPVAWKYRGQVLPTNHEVVTMLEIVGIVDEPMGVLATAKGSLWVDGLKIYAAENLSARIVSAAAV